MDAREKLRQYLEQRREMGETELVLDTLAVDDVLKLVGARTPPATGGGVAAPKPKPKPAAPAPMPPAAPATTEDRADARTGSHPAAPETPADPGSFAADWRQALTAAGNPRAAAGAPSSRAPRESKPPEAAATPSRAVDEGFAALLASAATTDALAEVIAGCTRCPLYSTAVNPVPGEGNPAADMMIVGEAPGQDEDQSGRPFVGRSGQLLTKILAAIGFAREDVFIANVLKHRPPANRNPKPDEVVACSPYLLRQIELVRPKVILALGTFAAQTLLESKLPIGTLRGQVHHYHGVPLIVTYHPAALLRNPAWKRPTWEDVQLARRVLDSAAGGA